MKAPTLEGTTTEGGTTTNGIGTRSKAGMETRTGGTEMIMADEIEAKTRTAGGATVMTATILGRRGTTTTMTVGEPRRGDGLKVPAVANVIMSPLKKLHGTRQHRASLKRINEIPQPYFKSTSGAKQQAPYEDALYLYRKTQFPMTQKYQDSSKAHAIPSAVVAALSSNGMGYQTIEDTLERLQLV